MKELKETIKETFRGVPIEYEEVYYLDYGVDEETYKIDRTRKEKFYTKEQSIRNSKAFKSAYERKNHSDEKRV